MNVQMAPPTFAENTSGQSTVGTPPSLGTPVPGTTGGLPAQGGLSVLAQPMAKQLQSMGRGEDTMLVHMTPNEVNSLQGLALASGGSLTINPHTGLPEAGWLGKLLPSILGVALAATGVGAPLAAGIVGLGQTALTGSLKKGLMAGLGAFGGASLAGAAGLGGAISNNAFGVLGSKSGILGANMGLGAQAANTAGTAGGITVGGAKTAGTTAMDNVAALAAPPAGAGAGATGAITVGGAKTAGTAALNNIAAGAGPTTAAQAAAQAAPQFTGGFLSKFGQAARAGLPGGMIGKAAPMMAGLGVLNSVSEATTPTGGFTSSSGGTDNSFQGPYRMQQRKVIANPTTEELQSSSAERNWFDVDQPEIYNMQGQVVQPGTNTAPGTPIIRSVPRTLTKKQRKRGDLMYDFISTPWMGDEEEQGFAKGGEVPMDDGAFVLDARTVSEIGNGSSNAGKELLRRIGGMAIEGPGDGVSDSVPARIGRDQPARVARDEVVIPARAVQKLGKGSPKRGADKLYALMDKAHKARRQAKRGQDTKLRKGLA